MLSTSVTTIAPTDAANAVQTIVLAFAADPVARWTWPRADDYLAAMPGFVLAFGGAAFRHAAACHTDCRSGAALWLPPGAGPDDEAIGELFERTVAPARRGDVSAVMAQMAAYHPREPHWYLPLIGVDPAHQSRGHGDALMRFALARCDRERLPAYLESTNPRNIPLYRRHGFEPLGTVQVGASPPIVPMVRLPR